MPKILNPDTVRPIPPEFAGIYAHSTWLDAPTKLVMLSGQIGVAMNGCTAQGFDAQCRMAMDHVEALLTAHGLALPDMMKVTYYLTRSEDLPALTAIRRERWHAPEPPAITTLVVAGLASRDLLVEIDVVAGR